uniref:CRAL-TRIO domain-containing protein n=1 Tax=Ascaris lumbricoides TaxID=6252 RepID=A0A9J2PIM9_ASCLU
MKAFLSEEEQCRVARLRSLAKEHLSEYYDTDFNLLRWLQGHSLSIDNIAEKLIVHLKARSSIWNLDGMHKNPRQHPIHTHHGMYITGLSGIIDNTLVAVEQVSLLQHGVLAAQSSMMCGQLDYWGMLQAYSLTEISLALVVDVEHLLARVMQLERETGLKKLNRLKHFLEKIGFKQDNFRFACGQLDYWGMLQAYSLTEISLALVVDVEHLLARVMQLERETGRQASVLYIMDLTGLKYDPRLYQLVVGPLKCLAIFISEHYAELIKYFVLAGAPPFVYPLYKIAKPLLPTRISDRVYIMSSPSWRSSILSLAKAESLPNKWNVGNENVFKFPVELPTRFHDSERQNLFAVVGYFSELLIHSFIIIKLMQTIYPSFGRLPGPVFTPIQGSIIANRSGYYKIFFISHCRWRPLNITFKITDHCP